MKNNGTVDFIENSINSLILVTKLRGNQNFSIQKTSKTLSNENNRDVNFAGNSFYSLISLTKLKRNQNFSILSILKIVFIEK